MNQKPHSGRRTESQVMYKVIEEEITVKENKDKNIKGLIFRPDNDGRFPVVIFMHGFGATYEDIMHYGNDFAMEGITCVFFDFYGGSPNSKSGGSMLEMSLETEVEDLRYVMDYVEELPYVDRTSLYLMGESMGGMVAAIGGARFYDEVKGLILWYPAFNIPDDARRRMKKGIKDIMGMTISDAFDKAAVEVDVVGIQERFDKPVLILHGDADDIVPIEYSVQAADAYMYALLHDIQGAGHGFCGNECIIAGTASISFVNLER